MVNKTEQIDICISEENDKSIGTRKPSKLLGLFKKLSTDSKLQIIPSIPVIQKQYDLSKVDATKLHKMLRAHARKKLKPSFEKLEE